MLAIHSYSEISVLSSQRFLFIRLSQVSYRKFSGQSTTLQPIIGVYDGEYKEVIKAGVIKATQDNSNEKHFDFALIFLKYTVGHHILGTGLQHHGYITHNE